MSAMSGDTKCPMLLTRRKLRSTSRLLLPSPEADGEKEERRCNCL